MSSIYAEKQHKLHPSHQLLSLKKSLRDIDIPPRKLLIRRAATINDGAGDMFSDETLLQKYLSPNNSSYDCDDGIDPYASDHFRMFEFKVRRCTRSRSHDWTDCPFAHPGERARRRDPRQFHYSGAICPEFRHGGCSRGDGCEFSHGVFECWLHPARYRTEPCKDGTNCKRKVCFFAHTHEQLRVLPHDVSSCNDNKRKCCLLCCLCSSSSIGSPTSTLFGVSQFSSPPLSPSPSSPSPSALSRFVEHYNNHILHHNHHGVDLLNDLVSSLEGLNFGEASPVSVSKPVNLPWLEDQQKQKQKKQLQFVLSPTMNSNSERFVSNGKYSSGKLLREERKVVNNDDVTPAAAAALDLGWVNDLLR